MGGNERRGATVGNGDGAGEPPSWKRVARTVHLAWRATTNPLSHAAGPWPRSLTPRSWFLALSSQSLTKFHRWRRRVHAAPLIPPT